VPVHTWAELRAGRVVLEDEAVLALDKPAGIPVVGDRQGADLVALARAAGEWLRPVHRIDRVTSGVVLLAKRPEVHAELTRQFARRTTAKTYLAITRPGGLPEHGRIELPLRVGRKNRVRVAAQRASIVADAAAGSWSVPPAGDADARSYPSLTTFARVWQDDRHAVLVVRPVTGRRHQIRVHLAWIGHPVEGDPLFDRQAAGRGDRTALHAWRLAFDAAWDGGRRVAAQAAPGSDFWSPVAARLPDALPEALLRRADRALAQQLDL
jgi:tRNA pseudouridine32 synthase/23S rRNA pseudouridine746 synthase/23S rRNA pseudouridine1911/1915/1917 synthase